MSGRPASSRADELPALSEILSLRFTRFPPRVAYSVAGSFLRFFSETEGIDALRDVHRLGSLGAAGHSLADAERAWREHLAGLILPEGTADRVALMLLRGSIFETVCPHRVASLRADLSLDMHAADWDAARSTCRELLAIDPNDVMTQAIGVGVRARAGQIDEARAELDALRARDAPRGLLEYAEAALGDAYFTAGENDEALARYAAALDLSVDESRRRQIEVKRLGLEASPTQARLVRAMLIGREGEPPGAATVMHLAHELDAERGDGLGRYLVGRALAREGEFARAIAYLEGALRRGTALASVEREARRQLYRALFAAERWSRLSVLLEAPDSGDGLETDREEWRRRLAFARDPEGSGP